MDDTTPPETRRFNPRFPLTGWHTDGPLFVWMTVWTIATVLSVVGSTSYLTWLYDQAGVRGVNFVGPAIADVAVAVAVLIAATLWRWGHPRTFAAVPLAVAAVIAAGVAVLPHLLIGRGWVVTMFGTMFGLTFWATATVTVFSFAIHEEKWWWGWHDQEMDRILAEMEDEDPEVPSDPQ